MKVILFFPWYKHPEYVMPPPADFVPNEDEQNLAKKYGLRPDQLAWRRRAIEEDFRGDVDEFNEKFPDCWEHAFKASKFIVFSTIRKTLERLMQYPFPEGKTGEIVRVGDEALRFQPDPEGKVEIFGEPVQGKQYVMGTDVGEGIKDKDLMEYEEHREGPNQIPTTYSTCVVCERSTWEVCALMECRLSETIFADKAMELGLYYNSALWGIEIPGPGKAVIGRVLGKYRNLYRNEYRDIEDDNRVKVEFGWRNSARTKPQAEANWEAFIREEGQKVNSNRIIGQALTYVVDPKNPGSMSNGPKRGCFSDLLIAHMIALWLLQSKQVQRTGQETAQGQLAQLAQRQRKRAY